MPGMADDPISALADEVRRLRQDVAGMRAELVALQVAVRQGDAEAARRHRWLAEYLLGPQASADISDDPADLSDPLDGIDLSRFLKKPE